MNYRFLIINALMLLYWEREIENNPISHIDTIKEIMGELRLGSADMDGGGDVYANLHALIIRICAHPNDKIDKVSLLRQIKIMANHDQYVSDIIAEGLDRELDEDAVKEECLTLAREITKAYRKLQFINHLKEVAKEYVYSEREFTIEDAARSVVERFENFAVQENESISGIEGVVQTVDLTDEEEVKYLFEEAINEISPDEILKFGLAGINRLFGKQGGGRRGETIIVGGLTHHGKSVTTMGMMRGIAAYNIPKVHKPGKIPTILLISSENDLTINIRELYFQCFVNTYHCKPMSIPDEEEAARFIKKYFSANGWKVYMVRVNPDEFTLKDMQELVYTLESSNHEIIACCFDYLAMMSTKGIDAGGITGRDKQVLLKRVRNMFTVRKTLFMTPHQLSTEALAIERDRPSKFLDEILNRKYYADCKSMADEADFEINLQKVIVDGIVYVYYGRGKHRGVNDTPEGHKRCCYQIGELGILDDVNGPPTYTDKPGKPVLSDADPWAANDPSYTVAA